MDAHNTEGQRLLLALLLQVKSALYPPSLLQHFPSLLYPLTVVCLGMRTVSQMAQRDGCNEVTPRQRIFAVSQAAFS